MKLLWVDFETTGLNPLADYPLEIAAIVTDGDLNELGRYEALYWRYPNELAVMNDFVREMHHKSGLMDALGADATSWLQINQALFDLVGQFDEKLLLAGSSVHFDRSFLRRWHPELERELHYRNIDVSTLRSLAREWAPGAVVEWEPPHRAMPDLEATIEELRGYRSALFETCGPFCGVSS